jgi:hypothetical protein
MSSMPAGCHLVLGGLLDQLIDCLVLMLTIDSRQTNLNRVLSRVGRSMQRASALHPAPTHHLHSSCAGAWTWVVATTKHRCQSGKNSPSRRWNGYKQPCCSERWRQESALFAM